MSSVERASHDIPERFLPAYQCIQRLERYERYQAALIFGSLVRGETTEYSDLDVIVIVGEDNPCGNINHPIIGGVKLDLTFRSLDQVKTMTEKTIAKRERIPVVAESLIVFDKTHKLMDLQEKARQVRVAAATAEHYQFIQFMLFHSNNKVERYLSTDPASALLSMHLGLNELLKHHYRLQGRWWVSSKRLLPDLRDWDPALAQLVERFVTQCEIQAKFRIWSAIIDYILAPLGGRQPIAENNCTCHVCQGDLAVVQPL